MNPLDQLIATLSGLPGIGQKSGARIAHYILKKDKTWEDVFDLVITLADKPLFFERGSRFLEIDPKTGLMSNHETPIKEGFFQGGSSRTLERDLGIAGNDILYLGDHIFGDVVAIKKRCNWRTEIGRAHV